MKEQNTKEHDWEQGRPEKKEPSQVERTVKKDRKKDQ